MQVELVAFGGEQAIDDDRPAAAARTDDVEPEAEMHQRRQECVRWNESNICAIRLAYVILPFPPE